MIWFGPDFFGADWGPQQNEGEKNGKIKWKK